MSHHRLLRATRAFSAAFALAALVALVAVPHLSNAQPTSSPSVSPSVSAGGAASGAIDPVETRAREWLGRLQRQPPAVDRSQLSAALSQAYDDVTIAAMARQVADLGAPTTFVALRTLTLADGSTAHVYRVSWTAGALDYLFALDSAGKITALYFRPAV